MQSSHVETAPAGNAPHVQSLRTKHAGLETRLRQEQARPAPDDAMIQDLKKQKLRLKQEIADA